MALLLDSRVATVTAGAGGVVDISSIGAVHPPKPMTHCNSAKAGNLGLTYEMTTESAWDDLTINAILTGPINIPPTPSRAGGLPGQSSTRR
jgi:NAD(P)-dependent dehydrogenase (short-subunit alcohol dehydrogenase family)